MEINQITKNNSFESNIKVEEAFNNLINRAAQFVNRKN